MFSVFLLKYYVSISPNTLVACVSQAPHSTATKCKPAENKMYTCHFHVPWLFWATTKLVLTI